MPSRRQALRLAGAGLATALAGCAARPPRAAHDFEPLADTALDTEAFAQFQGGLRNHGYVEATVPDAVTVDWSLPVNRGDHTAAKSTPIATLDGDILVAADTGDLRRVTPGGEVVWTSSVDPTTRGIHGTPAVANGSAYVGAYDGALYAFDLSTGDRQWRVELGDAIGSSPVYYNGYCYIAVEYYDPSGSIAAVDARTGDVAWYDGRPANHPHSTIGIDREAGRLVVGANDGVCYGWTFPEMERAWTFETDGEIKGPVALHDGLAVFGSWDDTVYAVGLEDGREAWTFEPGSDVMTGPAVAPDGTVYVGSHDSRIYALDGTNGEERWRFDTGGYVIGSLTATPGTVLAGSWDGTMYAVDADTGRERWLANGHGHATSAVLVREDALYYAERATESRPGNCYRLVPA